MMRSRAIRGPLWLIAKYETSRMAVLTIDRGDAGETLPIFGHEEEAETYLWLAAPAGWQARRTTAGELISVLCGPCAGVKKVTLDPLPTFNGIEMTNLASVGRERFLRSLMDERGPWAPRQPQLRAEVTVVSNTSESPAKKGAPMRENGERRERTQNESARHELERRLYLGMTLRGENGADDVAVPDYVMMDFGSRDGSHDAHDGRLRAPQASKVVGEEDLGQDRE